MGREQFPTRSLQVLDALFDLAREEPVENTLARVVEVALEVVPSASHSSVTLGDGDDLRSPVCSDGVAKELEEAQYAAGSGPCLEAVRQGEAINIIDLCSEVRWPRFSEEARRRGVKASMSLPLQTSSGTTGALNLYSDEVHGFGPDDEDIASLIASRAAVWLANVELFYEAKQVSEQLREALRSRDVIGQAKGIVMATEGCSDEDAFKMLVTASQHSNRKLRDIAKAILDQHAARIQG